MPQRQLSESKLVCRCTFSQEHASESEALTILLEMKECSESVKEGAVAQAESKLSSRAVASSDGVCAQYPELFLTTTPADSARRDT